MAHAWKVCKLQKGFAGSNPALSAEKKSKTKQKPVSQHLQAFFLGKRKQKNADKSIFLVDFLVDLDYVNLSPPE